MSAVLARQTSERHPEALQWVVVQMSFYLSNDDIDLFNRSQRTICSVHLIGLEEYWTSNATTQTEYKGEAQALRKC